MLTNTHCTSPYRGDGRPEASYMIERAKVAGDERIRILPLEFPGRLEGVGVVLMMDFEVRQRQKKGGLHAAQEALRAFGGEIGAVLAGEVDGLAFAVEEVAFVGVGRQFEGD